jgi:hypothetical protein
MITLDPRITPDHKSTLMVSAETLCGRDPLKNDLFISCANLAFSCGMNVASDEIQKMLRETME